MHAKPEMGDALFELTTNLHYTGDPDGPVDWVLCRAQDEPDTLWAFEFYKDEESFTRHYSDPKIDKVHEKVFELLTDTPLPLRADVQIVASSHASGTEFYVVKENSIYKKQPGVVLSMHAKPEMGDALFELITDLHYTGDPDGPVGWGLCRQNDEPDTLWAFEFYKDEESFTRHYSDPEIDKVHEKVFELLADTPLPLRADVHIVASSAKLPN
jgi:quinol monooxygenase YgiN